MKNVYQVNMAAPVETVPAGHHFSGKSTQWLYVIASSFTTAEDAVRRKYPGVDVRSLNLVNYNGLPLVIGD